MAIVPRRETFYDARLMSKIRIAKLTPVIGGLLVAATVFVLPACGSDHEDPGAGVAAACNSSCNATSAHCNLSITEPACANLCGLGYTIAPACAATYQGYVECTGASPLVACNGSSVTVNVSVPCLDQLGNYLTCAVGNIGACFDVPLDNAACTQAKLGPNARACLGQPPAGCTLLAGVQAGTQTSAGVFCCA